MPIQVVGREQVQERMGAADRAQKREEMLNEMGYKKAYIRVQEHQLKIQARNADTEADKLRYQRKADAMTMASKAMDIAKDMPNPSRFMAGWAQTYKDAARELGDPDFVSGWENFQESGASQKDRAQADEATAHAEWLRNGPGGSRSTAINGTNPIQTGAAGTGGTWEPDTASGTGPTYKYVDRARAMTDEANKAYYAKQGGIKAEMEPILNKYGKMKEIFSSAIAEMGGAGESALGATIKGTGANIVSEVGNMPATQAFNKVRDGFALELASVLNKGRPTDKDQLAAFKLLFSNKYPMATNRYLMDYLETSLNQGNTFELYNIFPHTYDAQGNKVESLGHSSFVTSVKAMADADEKAIKARMAKGNTREQAEQYIYEYKKRKGIQLQ